MNLSAKDFIFTYLEYLHSIRQSTTLTSVLESKDHNAWNTQVLVMIAQDEYDEICKDQQPSPEPNIMSMQELVDKLQVANRDKKIEKILDK